MNPQQSETSSMNECFQHQLNLPVTAEEAYSWHGRPSAMERLIPPWQPVQIAERGEGIHDGSIVKKKLRLTIRFRGPAK
jgi:ligand-binding SRPBCC domain-containing protein